MFEWVAGVIAQLGYVGVAALTFLENVFPPIPSELILPLAGYVAATGELRLGLVIAAGTVGSLAGATFWYVLAKRAGEKRFREWVRRHGRWLTLSVSDVDRAQAWFKRRGKWAVLIGRLLPGVRTFVSLPAGFSGMPWPTFLFYSVIGTLAWTAALVYAGAILQANFGAVGRYIDMATNILFAGVAVMMVVRYVRCFRAAA